MLRETTGGIPAAESNTVLNAAPLFNDFVQERYLPFAQQNKRSEEVDCGNLKRHILPYRGKFRLSDITSETLHAWIDVSAKACLRTVVMNCALGIPARRQDTQGSPCAKGSWYARKAGPLPCAAGAFRACPAPQYPNDTLAEKRHAFVQEYFGKINGKTASENIYDLIISYLENQGGMVWLL